MSTSNNKLAELAHKVGVERWSETPIKSILQTQWQPISPSESHVSPLNKQLIFPEAAILLTLCNGIIDPQWFDDKQLPEGMLVRVGDQKIDIQIMAGTKIERAIVIHNIAHFEAAAHPLVEFTINITLESQASAHFLMIESGDQSNQDYLLMPNLTICIDEMAKCHFVRAGLNSEQGICLMKMQVQQAANSIFHLMNYQSGGKISRSDIQVTLNGEFAENSIFGLNIAKNKQHLANVIDMDHSAANCNTNQQMKSLLKDQSMVLFDGKIHVFLDAQKTDARQLTRSLLLSDKTRALTVPRLEIYADDVKCTHGATVGSLDADHLFYLRSRGIGIQEAKQILMHAFAIESLDNIELNSIKVWMLHVLTEDLRRLI